MTARVFQAHSQAVADFLQLHFAGQAHESFAVLYLDAQHALLAFEDLFRGTLTQTSVCPREIIKRALHHNAAAVILAHNHPSGSTDPSPADRTLTQVLRSALGLVDVQVVDHLVRRRRADTVLRAAGLL